MQEEAGGDGACAEQAEEDIVRCGPVCEAVDGSGEERGRRGRGRRGRERGEGGDVEVA